MRGASVATAVLLRTVNVVLYAQTPADTLSLARGTAVAIATIAYPPNLHADSVILEPKSPWEAVVVHELRPRLGSTSPGKETPRWVRLSTHGLRIEGDSATVHVEVSVCSRKPYLHDDSKAQFYVHEFMYLFRREWSGWDLARVLPGSVGDGMCDPTAPPGELGLIPRIEYVERDTEPVLLNGSEVRGLLEKVYADSLKKKGIGGRALLLVQVDESGEVAAIEVRASSGHELLDEAAREIIASMRFRPAENRGKPVSVWIAQPIEFRPGS